MSIRPRPCLGIHPEPRPAECEFCWKFVYSQPHRSQWQGEGPALPPDPAVPFPEATAALAPPLPPIDHDYKGRPVSLLAGTHRTPRVRIKYCSRHGGSWDWVAVGPNSDISDTGTSPSRQLALKSAAWALRERECLWACGLTTVGEASAEWAKNGFANTKQQRAGLLNRTLASLSAAGFPEPHVFVDGAKSSELPNATCRFPAVLTWANWWLGFQELVARNPNADAYAMFQDDLVACKHLKLYLETCLMPGRGYLNLYTFPENEAGVGWHEAPDISTSGGNWQGGRGALALVFPRPAALTLLEAQSAARKCLADSPEIRHKKADGGIVTAMNLAGFREYVHSPSLVQHTGDESSMGNGKWGRTPSFPGEDFDALELLLIA